MNWQGSLTSFPSEEGTKRCTSHDVKTFRSQPPIYHLAGRLQMRHIPHLSWEQDAGLMVGNVTEQVETVTFAFPP
jgi:hypothetical protein